MCEKVNLVESIKIEQNRKVLKWKFDKFGLFEATIWDGQLTDFRACESGSQTVICTGNLEFLKSLQVALNDLITEIEKPKMQYKQLSIEFENEN
jgi:hypothetical protein